MEPAVTVDVLVVGAGPAGAAAACVAGRAGLRVLLADDGHPRPAHDVMVSGAAAERLAGLGVELADRRRIDGFDLSFPACTRRITGSDATITDAGSLRAGLAGAARAAGARLVTARVTDLSADGFPHAKHVVIAVGARGGPSSSDGIACARRFGGLDLGARVLMAPVTPAADPRALPAMVTVLPGADATATVWLARLGGRAEDDPDGLLAETLGALARRDSRFAGAHPVGRTATGRLCADFSPDRLASARELIIGDAAGLLNPFTGEGLGAALLSGTLAAEAIARYPGDPSAARDEYVRRVSAEYVGYFETARHAARRYHLVWRMLEGAAASDHAFLSRARRAVLLPQSAGCPADERVPVAPPDRIVTGPFLFACDEVQVSTLRVQWPFLARLLVDGTGFSRHRIRSGLLFLAGLLAGFLAGDGKPDVSRATPAAAIELATFGALAFLGAEEGQCTSSRSVDWAGATLVLAGDFLLSQASRLIAESAPALSWSFADWLAELAELRGERLSDRAGKATALHASLMEFPARAGALLGGCDDETAQAMRGIGNALGEAFGHAEDVLALSGQRTRLDATLATMIATRTSAISDLTATAPELLAGHLDDAGFRASALAASRQACADALTRARGAIGSVPGPMARRILQAYATAIEPRAVVRDSAVGAPRQWPILFSAGLAAHARGGGDEREPQAAPTGPDSRAGRDLDSGGIHGAAVAGSGPCADDQRARAYPAADGSQAPVPGTEAGPRILRIPRLDDEAPPRGTARRDALPAAIRPRRPADRL
jgi:2-polyprenyl-6-methoxyphenol hydroxylase-like FAD-dependent oxidoreductase